MAPSRKPQPASILSAREQFARADIDNDAARDTRRAELRNDMSEDLYRIAMFLPQLLADEQSLNAGMNSFDGHKLCRSYFGGWPLERIAYIRMGVANMDIGLCSYSREDVEQMSGFRDLVRACASPEVGMDITTFFDPQQACDIARISLNKPFDHDGKYKDIIAKSRVVQGMHHQMA